MLSTEDEQLLDEIYKGEHSDSEEGAFGTPDKLWRAVRKIKPSITKLQVTKWLNNNSSSYVRAKLRAYSSFPRKVSARFGFPSKPGRDLQLDTLEMKRARDFKFITVGVDSFSLVMFTRNGRANNAKGATEALSQFVAKLKESGGDGRLSAVYTDGGMQILFSFKKIKCS